MAGQVEFYKMSKFQPKLTVKTSVFAPTSGRHPRRDSLRERERAKFTKPPSLFLSSPKDEEYLELPSERRSSVQSVLVRGGCVFFGYESDWSGGEVVVVNANRREDDLADVCIWGYSCCCYCCCCCCRCHCCCRCCVCCPCHCYCCCHCCCYCCCCYCCCCRRL